MNVVSFVLYFLMHQGVFVLQRRCDNCKSYIDRIVCIRIFVAVHESSHGLKVHFRQERFYDLIINLIHNRRDAFLAQAITQYLQNIWKAQKFFVAKLSQNFRPREVACITFVNCVTSFIV